MQKFTDGNQTIFFKSATNMEEIAPNSIDAIITSPPYNVGKNYSLDGKAYNDAKSSNEYLSFLTTVFRECFRVASDKCLLFLNIGDSAKSQGKSEDVVKCAVNAGFTRLQTIIWVKSIFGKGHYTPSGRNRRLNNLWEYIFVLYKTKNYEINPKAIGIPYSDKSNIGRYSPVDLRDAGDIWFIPYTKTTGKKIKKGHDAPFPVELPLKCLKLMRNPQRVLDPFAGTGSTLRAAKELGIEGYGYELMPWVELIQERLNFPINEVSTPLLPQMEQNMSFLTQFVDKCIETFPEERIKAILDEFKLIPQRQFLWASKDIKNQSKLLPIIQANPRIKRKKRQPTQIESQKRVQSLTNISKNMYLDPKTDPIVRYYDETFGKSGKNELAWYDSKIEQYGGPILDLACGTGRFSLRYAKRGYQVSAIDQSMGMYSRFKQEFDQINLEIQNRITFHHESMTEFNFPQKFNTIICVDAFFHLLTIEDEIQCLRQIKEHLTPNGRFFFNVHNENQKFLQHCRDLDGKTWVPRQTYIFPETKNKLQIDQTHRLHSEKHLISTQMRFQHFTPTDELFKTEFSGWTTHYHNLQHYQRICNIVHLEVEQVVGTYENNPVSKDSQLIFQVTHKN